MRDSFIFYKSWGEVLSKLSGDVRLEVLDAVIMYGTTGNEPTFANAIAEVAFNFIKLDIDRNSNKYEALCDKRKKAIQARWDKSKSQPIQADTNHTNVYKCIQTDTKHTNEYKSYKRIHNDNDNVDEDVDVDDNVDVDENIINDVQSNTNKKKRKSTRFVVPTLAEIQEYIKQNHYDVDAQKFLDYYTANGWMIGKAKVKDWRACIRTWQRNERTGRSSASSLTLTDNSQEKYDDDSLKW